MNIFVLDLDPEAAARFHVDKHVVKMPLETAQLLCSVHHVLGSADDVPYRLTHRNHPCATWARKSLSNYRWLVRLGMALCREYTHRYGRTHKSQAVIEWCRDREPDLPDCGLTPFAQAVPEEHKSPDAVWAYRRYYMADKKRMASWKKRQPPPWFSWTESLRKAQAADVMLSLGKDEEACPKLSLFSTARSTTASNAETP